MAHYAIGDLQGCYTEFIKLLNHIEFNHGTDTLWLVGDIVNRGHDSLACLQFCMQHESSVQMVLGNHDLHLLAIAYGYGRQKRSDTLTPILQHPDVLQMRDWLRHQPFMRHNQTHVLVHAGLFPEWTVDQAAQFANEVAHQLQHDPHDYFANMYGNLPEFWSPDLTGSERLRFITNVLTRMRVLNPHHGLNHEYKGTYDHIPTSQYAWFDAPNRQHLSHQIVFGHWSALGFLNDKGVIALDTGALWGGQLTAINLATNAITQIQSQQHSGSLKTSK